jgi:hypothetical protein
MNPGTAQAGRTTHITVAVADAADQSAVLDAAVFVEVWSSETGERVLATAATTEQSTNKLYYETDFTLPETGPVEIKVSASGAAGEGQARYQTEVAPAQNRTWLMVTLIGVGALAVAIIWHGWSGRSKRVQTGRQRAAQRQRG